MAPNRRKQGEEKSPKEKGTSSRTEGQPGPKRLSPQRRELIQDFLESVALKDVRKYGGMGKGKTLWRQEVLELLNSQRRSGVEAVTQGDLNRWLAHETLTPMVTALEQSVVRDGGKVVAVQDPYQNVAASSSGADKRPAAGESLQPAPKKFRPGKDSKNDSQPTTAFVNESQPVAAVQEESKSRGRKASSAPVASGSGQGTRAKKARATPGVSGTQQASGGQAVEPAFQVRKTLTAARRAVITDFLAGATKEIAKYSGGQAKDSWKADLLAELNSSVDSAGITAEHLEGWLKRDTIKPSLEVFLRALNSAQEQRSSVTDGQEVDDDDDEPEVSSPPQKVPEAGDVATASTASTVTSDGSEATGSPQSPAHEENEEMPVEDESSDSLPSAEENGAESNQEAIVEPEVQDLDDGQQKI